MIASDEFSVTQFDILRHGQCEGGDIFRGSTDVKLTPAGFASMRTSCDIADTPWDAVISSPLVRCRAFAEAYAHEKHLPFTVDTRLREMSFGAWEGQQRQTIWENQHADILTWMQDPSSYTPPGGEPLDQVAARLDEFFAEVSANYRNQNVLLVAHGGLMRIFLSRLIGLPINKAQNFEVPFACLSRIKIYDKGDSRMIKLAAHNFVSSQP
ncbi:histidine phosphatase family protein [Teredinibacter turnerae]|uniref:histidine phosphatase family protein n=1 Tax=Teredinibacter turnerae TaxID=2426 RepID=UPI00036D9631|nr:histidine phosphatase family protein [Teredinibacter turnerae]